MRYFKIEPREGRGETQLYTPVDSKGVAMEAGQPFERVGRCTTSIAVPGTLKELDILPLVILSDLKKEHLTNVSIYKMVVNRNVLLSLLPERKCHSTTGQRHPHQAHVV